MTAAWNERRRGEIGYRREIGAGRKRWRRAAAAGFDKLPNWPGEYPDLRVRRDIQYRKAAVFIHTPRLAGAVRALGRPQQPEATPIS